jgi:site-specific DNA-methyltransferase (adenine-specific)
MKIYTGSFLEPEFNNHMKEVWGVEKFDIIVQNPPYNSDLTGTFQSTDIYDQFVLKSIKNSNIILSITPSRWMTKNDKFNFRNLIINTGLVYIITNSDINYFKNTNISGGICYYLISNGYNDNTLFNNNYINLKEQHNKLGIILEKYDNTMQSILLKIETFNKINNFNSQSYFNLKTNFSNISTNGIKIYYSDRNGNRLKLKKDNNSYYSYVKINEFNDTKQLLNNYKVMTPSAYGYKSKTGNYYNRLGKIFIAGPNEICTESYIFFNFKTKKESENFKKYLESKFVKYLISLKKNKQHVTSKIFEFVPAIDLSNNITDEYIYKYFNLNNNEIKYIENIINF